MKIINERTMNDFDMTINRYLIFLVHVQKSSLMQISEKMVIFNTAINIASEIKANVNKTLSNVNGFNIKEKRIYINKILLKNKNNITKEIDGNKSVKICEDELPLFNKLIETLKIDTNGIHLSSMNISNLFSYKKLNKDENTDLQKLKGKLEDGLEDIKKKAFASMLKNNNKNPELFYKVNNFILNKCKTENINFYVLQMPEDKYEGLFFIINRSDLVITRRNSSGRIDYSIEFNDYAEYFEIKIDGKIRVNNTTDSFNINETYPNSIKTNVLNAYNIRQIIELFNLLYKERIMGDSKPEKNNDIDNYLEGKIKND